MKGRTSTRKRSTALINPDDPRWDIRIGIPVRHMAELLILNRPVSIDHMEGEGGGHRA